MKIKKYMYAQLGCKFLKKKKKKKNAKTGEYLAFHEILSLKSYEKSNCAKVGPNHFENLAFCKSLHKDLQRIPRKPEEKLK